MFSNVSSVVFLLCFLMFLIHVFFVVFCCSLLFYFVICCFLCCCFFFLLCFCKTIFLMFLWSKIVGAAGREVWDVWYYNPPWSTSIDALNSIPLFAFTALLGFVLYSRNKTSAINAVLLFGSLAALIHLLLDLPLHVDDAHAHFWPLSHWKFVSPISYWDPSHQGRYWTVFEAVLGCIVSVILWRRFPSWWLRILFALAIIVYIAAPSYFIWNFGMTGRPSP